jgi:hypothetical protein
MELRLDMVVVAAESIGECNRFELVPVNGAHVRGASDEVVYLFESVVHGSPRGEASFKNLFDQRQLGIQPTLFMTSLWRVPHGARSRKFFHHFAFGTGYVVKQECPEGVVVQLPSIMSGDSNRLL